MKKTVRVTLYKEYFAEVDCDKKVIHDLTVWVPKDESLLLDLVRDHGEEFDFEYEVIR